MSEPPTAAISEIPVFSECVLGFRAWAIDDQDRLWPISDRRCPWEPGINTARCNCTVQDSLSFDWTFRDGRRVLEPHPQHDAPSADCVCGLYSWRRPPGRWQHDPGLASASRVCGAVASWGRLQVHGAGFRAEHACVVTLAYPPGTGAEEISRLERIAARYRVELVALDALEQAASRHGSPLPDVLQPEEEPEPASRQTPPPRLPPESDEPAAAVGSQRESLAAPEPLAIRERSGIAVMLLSMTAVSSGSLMWLGRGTAAWIGVCLVLAGCVGITLTVWLLEPHKAARHARHNVMHRFGNARTRREQPQPTMSDTEFEAIEDALEPLYRHGNDMSNNYNPYGSLWS